MTEGIDDMLGRLEALQKDIRRQGRASIAAQSAAESCLESVQSLQARLGEPAEVSQAPEPAKDMTKDMAKDTARAFAPVIDALERTTDQALSFAQTAPRPSALARWLGATDNTAAFDSMAKGTRLLRAQLEDALAIWNITVDRRVGVPVDPSVHRVVDTRPAANGEQPDLVAEIVRPALMQGDRVLREADVVATRQHDPDPNLQE